MDVTKFRPNIVVSGANEPWEEDYWAELQFTPEVSDIIMDSLRLTLERNCLRCRSINVDYKTGEQSNAESGRVLALLQKDRRIDAGMRYSPAFGRYAFLSSDIGEIAVGMEVTVLSKNQERSFFDWKLH